MTIEPAAANSLDRASPNVPARRRRTGRGRRVDQLEPVPAALLAMITGVANPSWVTPVVARPMTLVARTMTALIEDAVLARGGAVGLLERLEDQAAACPSGMPTPVSVTAKAITARRAQHVVAQAGAVGRVADRQRHAALVRELERVREQVLEDLLEPLLVGDDRARAARVEVDLERQALLLGHVAERPLGVLVDLGQRRRRRGRAPSARPRSWTGRGCR